MVSIGMNVLTRVKPATMIQPENNFNLVGKLKNINIKMPQKFYLSLYCTEVLCNYYMSIVQQFRF